MRGFAAMVLLISALSAGVIPCARAESSENRKTPSDSNQKLSDAGNTSVYPSGDTGVAPPPRQEEPPAEPESTEYQGVAQ
jgi:hypothetical protein